MRLQLVSADFDEKTITFKIPLAVLVDGKFRRLHYHPCEVEVDLTEFTDEHPGKRETRERSPSGERDPWFAIPDDVITRVDRVLREAMVKVREYLTEEQLRAKPLDTTTVYASPAPAPRTPLREALVSWIKDSGRYDVYETPEQVADQFVKFAALDGAPSDAKGETP